MVVEGVDVCWSEKNVLIEHLASTHSVFDLGLLDIVNKYIAIIWTDIAFAV